MLNKRRKREKLPDYAVRFIGYSARSSRAKEMPNMRSWISLAERQDCALTKAACL